MNSVSPKHVIALIGAMASVTMLILGLSAPDSRIPGNEHIQAVHAVSTSHCRIASYGNTTMRPGLYDNPLIHDLMTSAVSIADRL
jgi:hypothetical protein